MLNTYTISEIEDAVYILKVAEFCLQKTSGLFCSHKKNSYWTDSGLCYLLGRLTKNYYLKVNILQELHELSDYRRYGKAGYWWRPGRIKPRLKLVRKAIKQFEDEKIYILLNIKHPAS